MKPATPLASNHYVDNAKFYQACVEYKKLYNTAKDEGKPLPKIPDYIGECLMKIATKLSYSRNFVKYSYREEMIGDGIENCILYFHNFNPEKYNNPFSYFTQIIYFAFLRRIHKEKKQLYVKYKAMMNKSDEGLADINDFDVGEEFGVTLDENLSSNDYINDFVNAYESKHKERKDLRTKNKKKDAPPASDPISEFAELDIE